MKICERLRFQHTYGEVHKFEILINSECLSNLLCTNLIPLKGCYTTFNSRECAFEILIDYLKFEKYEEKHLEVLKEDQ